MEGPWLRSTCPQNPVQRRGESEVTAPIAFCNFTTIGDGRHRGLFAPEEGIWKRGKADSEGCFGGQSDIHEARLRVYHRPRRLRMASRISIILYSRRCDPKSSDEAVILLGTGLRISEMCGLTETDIDFAGRTVRVDHQLARGRRRLRPGVQGRAAQVREGRRNRAARWHDTAHAAPHVLHGDGEGGHEPEGAAIHHGPQGYQDDARVLRPHGRADGGGRDETRRGVVKRILLPVLLLAGFKMRRDSPRYGNFPDRRKSRERPWNRASPAFGKIWERAEKCRVNLYLILMQSDVEMMLKIFANKNNIAEKEYKKRSFGYSNDCKYL